MSSASSGTRRNERVRGAIYARKSSEEGLEQEFNSLQAQREACEAFIHSQRHEGWVCLRASYDDAGFSGYGPTEISRPVRAISTSACASLPTAPPTQPRTLA
jgi:hypothetical protein